MDIFVVLWIVINFLGFLKRDSRLIFLLQMTFIWILFSWNTGGIDYEGNEAIFNYSGQGSFSGIASGWLYELIAYFCHINNYGFLFFNCITGLLMVSALGYVILKETDYPCTVAILFVIYPLIDNVIQKRYAVGMALVILGIYFLQRNKVFMFIISVIAAFGMHFSFLVFILLMFWKSLDEKQEKYVIGIGFLVETLLLLFGRNILSRIFWEAKVNDYLYSGSYSSMFVGICFMSSILVYILLFYKVYRNEKRKEGILAERNLFIWRLNKLAVLLCPVCLLESAFMRYFRIILVFNFIMLADCFSSLNVKNGHVALNRNELWKYIYIIYFIGINIVLYMLGEFGISGYIGTLFDNMLLH